MPNKALHLTAITLRFIAASELGRWIAGSARMLLLLFTSIAGAALILYFGKRLKPRMRVTLVVLTLLLVNLPTILFMVVGDKAPPGARTVTQKELQKAAE